MIDLLARLLGLPWLRDQLAAVHSRIDQLPSRAELARHKSEMAAQLVEFAGLSEKITTQLQRLAARQAKQGMRALTEGGLTWDDSPASQQDPDLDQFDLTLDAFKRDRNGHGVD